MIMVGWVGEVTLKEEEAVHSVLLAITGFATL